MKLSTDHPSFTAAVLGEATLEESAAFEARCASPAGDAWRTEAENLRLTAARLHAALRQEPAPAPLSIAQRRAVLSGKSDTSATLPASVSLRSMSTSITRKNSAAAAARTLPRWTTSAGAVAAALAVGFFTVRAWNPLSDSANMSRSGMPPKAKVEGIPAIALDPGTGALSAQKPAISAPDFPLVPKQDPQLPLGSPMDGPAQVRPQESIATTAPDLKIKPPAAPKAPEGESGKSPLPASNRRGSGPGPGILSNPGSLSAPAPGAAGGSGR